MVDARNEPAVVFLIRAVPDVRNRRKPSSCLFLSKYSNLKNKGKLPQVLSSDSSYDTMLLSNTIGFL